MKIDIYTLAHEIKNPLCVAKGYLEMLNSSNCERYKRIIQEEINNSIEILDNYMELGKISLNKEEMDLNLLLLDIKSNMKDYLEKQGIKLKVKLFDDDIYLEADYNKLKQVFYNAIKNGIEAHCKKITISYEMMYDKIKIIIVNDGDSINIHSLNKIGHNYTNKILGHGIGTTISKKIIELHNGDVEYVNNKHGGVSTIITLSLL